MTKKKVKAEKSEIFNDQDHQNSKNSVIKDDKQIIEMIEENLPAKESFPIVGIGASAGGLEALESFFSNTIPNSGIAWIIVMHLDPTRESILSEIIKKYTLMPVNQIEDNMEIKPDCVYVIPPNHDIALKKNKFLLLEPTSPRGLRLPIDFFFKSLSEDQKDRAIGVILSGAGTDGTLGTRDIKGAGGIIIVQEPETAKYDSMPRSVINTTVVDYILPPDKIPKQLIDYVQKNISKQKLNLEVNSKDNLANFNLIIKLILNRTGHDFSSYRINTLIRRIERRMTINQIPILSDYIQKIQVDPKELSILTKELIIGVTNFFRDKKAYQLLEDKVIPALFQNRKSMESLRIWIPGCSTGEEAYSIAIIIQDYIEKVNQNYRFQIFATDVDESAIEKARLGIFPENISVDVTPERLQRFFIWENNFYQVIKLIREKIVFAVQNIIKDPPFSKLDFISCRNLFIYLIPEIQKKLLSMLSYSLNEGGFLFLGSSESVGDFTENFTIVDQKWKIYQKKEIKLSYKDLIRPFPPLIKPDEKTTLMAFSKVKEKLDYRKLMENILIKKYSPASVMINHKNEILFIYGHTGKFLELSTGEARMNVTEMAREDLKIELINAIRKVSIEKREYRREGLKVRSNGDSMYINLIVTPISEPPENNDLFLISFEEFFPKEPELANNLIEPPLIDSNIRIIKQLEAELSTTKKYLQTIMEEHETANEELQSSNEELQSTNEELQSTNEELQTSKEEIQSINEELNIVNVELQSKLNELSIVNSNLNNLISSTEIGTIFLDDRLNITRFSPSVTPLLNLIPSDLGRPLHHIASNLQYENLTKDAVDVLKTLVPKQFDVQTNDKKCFTARLIPHKTQENVISGVVITFVDITERKKIEKQLLKSEEKYRKAYNKAEFYKDLFTHDISNILQNIGNPIEFLLKHQFPKEISKDMGNILAMIKKIYDQYTRAVNLVSNIRKLSKIDDNINRLKKVNIVEILNNSIENCKKHYSQKVINIKTNIKFNEIYIQADNFLIDIFDNILINAIKHNNSSIIEIQVKVNKLLENNVSYVKCEFIDNGVGIPDSLKSRIFSEPIKNLNDSRMGIGLTLVSKIIFLYNGKISIEDRVSGDYTKGTNFILLIPEDF